MFDDCRAGVGLPPMKSVASGFGISTTLRRVTLQEDAHTMERRHIRFDKALPTHEDIRVLVCCFGPQPSDTP
jgi:hypothetical protein